MRMMQFVEGGGGGGYYICRVGFFMFQDHSVLVIVLIRRKLQECSEAFGVSEIPKSFWSP